MRLASQLRQMEALKASLSAADEQVGVLAWQHERLVQQPALHACVQARIMQAEEQR